MINFRGANAADLNTQTGAGGSQTTASSSNAAAPPAQQPDAGQPFAQIPMQSFQQPDIQKSIHKFQPENVVSATMPTAIDATNTSADPMPEYDSSSPTSPPSPFLISSHRSNQPAGYELPNTTSFHAINLANDMSLPLGAGEYELNSGVDGFNSQPLPQTFGKMTENVANTSLDSEEPQPIPTVDDLNITSSKAPYSMAPTPLTMSAAYDGPYGHVGADLGVQGPVDYNIDISNLNPSFKGEAETPELQWNSTPQDDFAAHGQTLTPEANFGEHTHVIPQDADDLGTSPTGKDEDCVNLHQEKRSYWTSEFFTGAQPPDEDPFFNTPIDVSMARLLVPITYYGPDTPEDFTAEQASISQGNDNNAPVNVALRGISYTQQQTAMALAGTNDFGATMSHEPQMAYDEGDRLNQGPQSPELSESDRSTSPQGPLYPSPPAQLVEPMSYEAFRGVGQLCSGGNIFRGTNGYRPPPFFAYQGTPAASNRLSTFGYTSWPGSSGSFDMPKGAYDVADDSTTL